MLKVGVTGGIGSGKSTVCRIFETLGIPVFRADDEGRRVLDEDKEVQEKVKALLGNDVIIQGKPDRKRIAEIVFNNPDKLQGLNSIIHPAVRTGAANWALAQHSNWVIEEAAIMFESGMYKTLDKIIVVSAPDEVRIKRVMARDRISEAMVKERIKNQITEEERRQRANYIIENDGIQMLISQVIDIYNKLTQLASK